MSNADKFVANLPGRMESHSPLRGLARPHCAIQELDPQERPMCDPLQEEEAARRAHGDPESYRLHVEFVHAHGVPKGPITTFSNACAVTSSMRGSNGGNGVRGK